MPFFIKIYNS